MSANEEPAETKDRRAILSTLWIFGVFNYLYVDLAMTIFRPETYQRIAARMSEWVVLAASVLLEIPIAMIHLSRMLKYLANRWANVVAGVVSTAFAGLPAVQREAASLLLTLFGDRNCLHSVHSLVCVDVA